MQRKLTKRPRKGTNKGTNKLKRIRKRTMKRGGAGDETVESDLNSILMILNELEPLFHRQEDRDLRSRVHTLRALTMKALLNPRLDNGNVKRYPLESAIPISYLKEQAISILPDDGISGKQSDIIQKANDLDAYRMHIDRIVRPDIGSRSSMRRSTQS